MTHSIGKFVTLAMALAAAIAPGVSFAGALQTDAAEDFADAQIVCDSDLDTMRGGFFNVDGMLIAFSFDASTTINGVQKSSTSLSDADITKAAAQGKSIQSLIPPTVIQNADNNVQIAVQQHLNLSVTGASTVIANTAQLTQAALQNARAFH